ncbi:MAG: diguanylate cyclase [Gammaproteobacteria bacterium]|nr:diguanylate cyclase [Gammaproteobacteria bacterium]
MNILVVDDEQAIREMISIILDDSGHSVTQADSGEAALSLFGLGAYHLVVTDICMGGMSGIELMKIIKSRSPNTRVIVSTAFASKDNAIEALRLGAFDYWEKSVGDLHLLAESVAKVSQSISEEEERQKLISRLQLEYSRLNTTQALLNEQVVRDPLTGFYNRTYLEHALQKELSRSHRFGHELSVILLDIDHFKEVNETYGSEFGDRVLSTLSAELAKQVRGCDILARYGGEEFVVVLPETSESGACLVADKLRKIVENTVVSDESGRTQLRLSISAGVAHLRRDTNGRKLLAQAGRALVRSKESGRNRVTKVSSLVVNVA